MQARRNLELKARCADPRAAAAAATALGAIGQGTLVQTDTYFQVSQGRLKLREHENARAELIWYARSDSVEFRESDYHVVPVPNPAELKIVLESALGLRGQVRKRRELYLWHNVRIHLDQVEQLGAFIEFEAVLDEQNDEALSLERLDILARMLAVKDEDRIAQSYSDLLGL
jgi:predicted adenylyl cyclase CyaB